MFTWEIMSSLFMNPNHVLTVQESSSNHERNHVLFKDSANSDLAQFDHAQWNSKKWPKGYKDQIVPNEIFLEKQLIKFPFTY